MGLFSLTLHSCSDSSTVTDIDGNVYQTVIIGEQEWFAENLRVTRYNNGDAISTNLYDAEWRNTESGAFAVYPHGDIDGINSENEMVEAYGRLYNWYAVDDARGLCPEGWSIPSYDDLKQLLDYVVNQGYPNEPRNVNGAGNALKSCRQVGSPLDGDCDTSEHPRWNPYSITGFDEFGFSALPGGNYAVGWYLKGFLELGSYGYWWSSSEASSALPESFSTSAYRMMMNNTIGGVHQALDSKGSGYSVRCVRDVVRTENE